MDPVGRLFLCGRCRAQVVICSRCDRGQIYCGAACSQVARRESQREAGRRYQRGRRGRFAHAERARRHRQRRRQKNNVTHQGSPAPLPDGLLVADSTAAARQPQKAPQGPQVAAGHCHFCGCRCAGAVRFGFLPRRVPPTDNPKRNST